MVDVEVLVLDGRALGAILSCGFMVCERGYREWVGRRGLNRAHDLTEVLRERAI